MWTKTSSNTSQRIVLKKIHFRDGLVWTVGLTVERKLRFQIPPAQCEWGLRKLTSSRLTEGSNSTMPAKDSTTTPSQLGTHHHMICTLLPCHSHIKAKARNEPAI